MKQGKHQQESGRPRNIEQPSRRRARQHRPDLTQRRRIPAEFRLRDAALESVFEHVLAEHMIEPKAGTHQDAVTAQFDDRQCQDRRAYHQGKHHERLDRPCWDDRVEQLHRIERRRQHQHVDEGGKQQRGEHRPPRLLQ